MYCGQFINYDLLHIGMDRIDYYFLPLSTLRILNRISILPSSHTDKIDKAVTSLNILLDSFMSHLKWTFTYLLYEPLQ